MIRHAVFGCGGAGYETLSLCVDLGLAYDVDALLESIETPVLCFFDDASRDDFHGFPVLGGLEEAVNRYCMGWEVPIVVGVGCSDMPVRARIFDALAEAGALFFSPVHPKAAVSVFARLGEAEIVMASVVIQAGVTVGNNCFLCQGATVGHDCVVGSNVYLSPQANLCGRVRIGDNVLIGAGAVILPERIVEAGATVGAGAVVTRDVPANTIVKGVPAKGPKEWEMWKYGV